MSTARYLHLMKALLLLLICTAAVLPLTLHRSSVLQWPELAESRCDVAGARGSEVFRVYMPSDWMAPELAQGLCQSALKGSVYGEVIVSWLPRESIGTGTLLADRFQLMWDREHVMSGLLPDFSSLYHLLKPMPDYEIDWFSHDAAVLSSDDGLRGQRIGLLDDPRSQSGYQLPRLQLAGMAIVDDAVTYYPNRSELMQAFMRGDVDVIPALPLQFPDWPAGQRRLLTDKAPIGSWFMSQSVDPQLSCQLLDALKLFDPVVRRLTTHALPPAGAECSV